MLDLIGHRGLRDLLDERVERHPDKTWLVFEDADGTVTRWTYRQFADRVDALAAGLAELGVGAGDRCTVYLPNCPEVLEVWFAAATIGAVFVPSNIGNTAPELRHVVSFSDSVLVITHPGGLATVTDAIAEDCPQVRAVVVTGPAPGAVDIADVRRPGAVPPRPALGPDDVLQMLFTSGTTARPKGVLLTHGNALHSGERESRAMLLDTGDRCLTALPVFHVNAQSLTVLSALTVGATVILLARYGAGRFWDQVRAHRATQVSIVAMMARTLLAQPPRDTDRDHDLRRVWYALNITTEERDAFQDRFGVEFVNAYGLSETQTLVTAAPVFGAKRWPSIGLPLPDRLVRLVDTDGNDVPRGEVGEIVVHGRPGRTLMLGYHNDPAATAATLSPDGWLRTGDNAYADEHGYLYFFDRRKDMIKRAGENVSTVEVESVLAEHPQIAEAAVVGVPDPIRDEAVKAVVVPADDTLTATAVQEFCAARLAGFKVPTIVEFRAELPKTSIGKIEKKQLREP